MSQIKPYKESTLGKKVQVAQMFDSISPRYDFLNRLLSFGIDVHWRKKLVTALSKTQAQTILDVATGTADLALMMAKTLPDAHITGIDISEGMLSIGQSKLQQKQLSRRIRLLKADAEKLSFEDNSFDALTAAFGVRNFENLNQGLIQMQRVLKPHGSVFILEFSNPEKFPMKQLYAFYNRRILSHVGRYVSKDPSAYDYLPKSVAAFPHGQQMKNILTQAGFIDINIHTLTFGIVTLYIGKKPLN